MKALSLKALATATALLTAGAATATPVTPLTIDTGWTSFAFGAVGTLAKRTYSFTLTGHAILKIVDGFSSGDRFQVFANNVSRGLTSMTTPGFTTGNKWDLAFANPNFSHRGFHFGPGTYTVSILVAQRSGTDTGLHNGAVRLDTSPVPVPAGGLLLISALGAAAAARRRKA
ncbi:MAG: VPLPA-CTERM sorting domain-containing protein [Proteobacteria bacterium]|nr:VPLPA-CTERM sorting domain-containing protein [Pseudomonadota bacterium]MBS0572607.1 VPLPA-CTERM sorting domain-containing protein [Pseudomonadota bacterium]